MVRPIQFSDTDFRDNWRRLQIYLNFPQDDVGAITDNSGGTAGTSVEALVADYCDIYAVANTDATSLSAQNVWHQFVNFTATGPCNVSSASLSSNDMTVGATGAYWVSFSASFSGGAGKTYEMEIQKNNGATVIPQLHVERKLGSTGDIGVVAASGVVSLTQGETIELWVRPTDVSVADPTLRDASMNLHRLDHDAIIDNNFATVVEQLNEIRAALRLWGIMA